MFELGFAIALAVLAFVVVLRILKKKAGAPLNTKREAAVEVWARSEIARILADKLEIDEPDLAATLGGNPDPDVVTRLERAVRKIEVAYERVPGHAAAADVRVEVSLENGKTERTIRRIEWTELPGHVAEELAKTGASHTFRPWLFPWQR